MSLASKILQNSVQNDIRKHLKDVFYCPGINNHLSSISEYYDDNVVQHVIGNSKLNYLTDLTVSLRMVGVRVTAPNLNNIKNKDKENDDKNSNKKASKYSHSDYKPITLIFTDLNGKPLFGSTKTDKLEIYNLNKQIERLKYEKSELIKQNNTLKTSRWLLTEKNDEMQQTIDSLRFLLEKSNCNEINDENEEIILDEPSWDLDTISQHLASYNDTSIEKISDDEFLVYTESNANWHHILNQLQGLVVTDINGNEHEIKVITHG